MHPPRRGNNKPITSPARFPDHVSAQVPWQLDPLQCLRQGKVSWMKNKLFSDWNKDPIHVLLFPICIISGQRIQALQLRAIWYDEKRCKAQVYGCILIPELCGLVKNRCDY